MSSPEDRGRLGLNQVGSSQVGSSLLVSVVSTGVHSISEHYHRGQVMSDTWVVLDVVKPPSYIHILLFLLDGQLRLEGGDGRNGSKREERRGLRVRNT